MSNNDSENYNEIDLCNFINSYYQLRDLKRFNNVKSVVIIGVGKGLDPIIFKWAGYKVVTYDINADLNPDYVGSVDEMDIFNDCEFDLAIVSHVVEHLPLEKLDQCLKEISRISKNAIIYLPVNGIYLQFRFNTNFRNINFSKIFTVSRFWIKPDNTKPKFMSGQHYWEVGIKDVNKKFIVEKLSRYFRIIDSYRNHDWLPSVNFLLTKK
jgi:hypothetical protein